MVQQNIPNQAQLNFLREEEERKKTAFGGGQPALMAPQGLGVPERLLGKRLGGAVRDVAEPVFDFATTPLIPQSAVQGLPTPLRVAGEAAANLTSPLQLGIIGASVVTRGATLPLLSAEYGGSLAYEAAEEANLPEPVQLGVGIAAGIAAGNPAKTLSVFRKALSSGGLTAAKQAIGRVSSADSLSLGLLPQKAPKKSTPRVVAYVDDELGRSLNARTPAQMKAEIGSQYLYHVTTATEAILQDGIIRTAARARFSGLRGLGSGGLYVSTSADALASQNIVRQYKRNIGLGKLLTEQADRSVGEQMNLVWVKLRESAAEDIAEMMVFASQKGLPQPNLNKLEQVLSAKLLGRYRETPKEYLDSITTSFSWNSVTLDLLQRKLPPGGILGLPREFVDSLAEPLHKSNEIWDNDLNRIAGSHGVLLGSKAIFTGDAYWSTAQRPRSEWWQYMAQQSPDSPKIIAIDLDSLDPRTALTTGTDAQNFEVEIWSDVKIGAQTSSKVMVADFTKYLSDSVQTGDVAGVDVDALLSRLGNPQRKRSSVNIADDLAFNNTDVVVLTEGANNAAAKVHNVRQNIYYQIEPSGPGAILIESPDFMFRPEYDAYIQAGMMRVGKNFSKVTAQQAKTISKRIQQFETLGDALDGYKPSLEAALKSPVLNKARSSVKEFVSDLTQASNRHGAKIEVATESFFDTVASYHYGPEFIDELVEIFKDSGFQISGDVYGREVLAYIPRGHNVERYIHPEAAGRGAATLEGLPQIRIPVATNGVPKGQRY